MEDKPAPDEMYCRSCGEIIKEDAEICPECGVRNTSSRSTGHDPSNYDTSVSGKWWYGVAAGTAFWTVFVLASVSMPNWEPGAAVGLGILVAWFVTPLAAYFDTQYIRANSGWNPNTALWVFLLLIWIANVPAGIVYLIRRVESMKK